MTKRKNTKRALVASVLSMLLCMAMLIGSTFAWFTDTVTTGKNKIVAGNLDVALEYATAFDAAGNPTTWTPVDTTVSLFSDVEADGVTKNLWEPGHTEVVYLKIRNAGTLALKYQFTVNAVNETGGMNVDGDSFKLSEHLVFGQKVNENAITKYKTREDAWTDAGEKKGLGTYTKKNEELLPGEEEYVALIVYMPTTVDNVANYRGETIPTIDLGVTLSAIQASHESDSFNDQYDKNLPYPVLDGKNLSKALNAGGKVILGEDVVYDVNTNSDIDTTGARTVIKGSTTLDLGGKTITFNSNTGNENFAAFYVNAGRAKMTVNGEGTIDATATTGAYCFHLYGSKLSKPTLTINGGTYIGNPTAVNVEYGTAYINGGFFNCKPAGNVTEDQYRYTLNCVDTNYDKGYAKIIVTGGTFVNFDPSNNQAEGPDTNFVADEYKVVSEEQENGDIWYTVVPDVPQIDEGEAEDPFGSM